MLRKLLFVLPLYLAIIGGGVFHVYQKNGVIEQNVALAAQSAEDNKVTEKAPVYYEGTPTGLFIPSLDLRLPVLPGSYNPGTQTWVLSADKAHFATETKKLNTKDGLSLIYGHYNSKVFKRTDSLQVGALIEVTTNTKKQFVYKYVDSSIVKPTDTSLFNYTGKPRLSLLTCTGTWFENRRIINFELVAVKDMPV